MSVSFKSPTPLPLTPFSVSATPVTVDRTPAAAPGTPPTTPLEIAQKPQLRPGGPRFKTPIRQVNTQTLQDVQRAVKTAKQSSDQLERMLARGLQDAEKTAKTAAPGPSSVMAEEKLTAFRAATARVEARGAALEALSEATRRFETDLSAVHEARARPIPIHTGARDRFFNTLIGLEQRVATAGEDIRRAFDAFIDASEAIEPADVRLAGVRDDALDPLRKQAEQALAIARALDASTLVPAPNAKAPGAPIEAQMADATGRAERLREQLDRFETLFGTGELARVLGHGRLKASVALQAMRAGESLSPALLNTITDPDRITDVQPLGAGVFNQVLKARLEDPIGTVREYALKPLDSRITTPGNAWEIGHTDQQVGVFGRQDAAHKLSEALGLNVAGAPRYVVHDNRLFMAAPIIPGHTKAMIGEKIKASVVEHNAGAAAGDVKSRSAEKARISEALHNNPSFQMACQKMQLLQSIISNPDGHGENMSIAFSRGGVAVDPGALIHMSDNEIAQLDVTAGVFDLDGAFLADPDIAPREVDSSWMGELGGTIAQRWHYVGPPPFHTKDQYDALVALQADLAGQLGEDLGWDLTSGAGNVHPGTKATELSALKSRVDQLVTLFDAQHDDGRRLDNAGHVLDANNQPTGLPDQQKRLSDASDTIGQYGLGDGNKVKQSLAHKYFPVEGSIVTVPVIPPSDPPITGGDSWHPSVIV
ncbi:MAG: hypothetical protein AAF318_01175 [Pseudomonadota bacterium]